MLEAIITAWHATSTLEIVSVLFGLAYVILAARENVWCWPAAFIGTGTAIWLFWDASLLMESALNVYYLFMALFGWWQWQKGGTKDERNTSSGLKITSWSLKQHLITGAVIMAMTFGSGHLLESLTGAKLPYLDSFTTWSAVITTWMVTRKILENWLYWVVIDAVSIYLFFDRGLYLYGLLFIAYTVIAIFGYLNWRQRLANSHDVHANAS